MDGPALSSQGDNERIPSDVIEKTKVHSAAEPNGITVSDRTGSSQEPDKNTQHDAAHVIQRNYRRYRDRRQQAGLHLTASARWNEAIKEAQYRNLIKVKRRAERPLSASPHGALHDAGSKSFAQQEWKRLAQIARRAGNDDTSEESGEDDMTPAELEEWRKKRAEEKKKREAHSRMMGLEYFLEMVDEKHRYGSHLRSYHAVWKQADTNENFFYWLDYGEGKDVEIPLCSREKLEKDQVRYLSREERYRYLVKIDKQGCLRWAKNGEKITTNYMFRDSIQGIVEADDKTPAFREDLHGKHHTHSEPQRPDSPESSGSEDSIQEGKHYVNRDLIEAKGIAKIQYVSAAALLNHLLQSTTKKNTWIFVADTSFRLYIGIKQSGAFQHSSFLHGGRISAAGLIKVKDGQLRSLSPLSGHYRPPTRNFREFVHSLKNEGCDMSRVSISKSYAVLLGLEGYMRTKKQAEAGFHEAEAKFEKIIHPEEAAKKAEALRDKSESAQKEKAFLEKQAKEEQEKKGQMNMMQRLSRKFSLRHSRRFSRDSKSNK